MNYDVLTSRQQLRSFGEYSVLLIEGEPGRTPGYNSGQLPQMYNLSGPEWDSTSQQ